MILEVIIPTFNRPSQLRETVNCLLSQITEKVSITIIDNASELPVTYSSLGISDLRDQCKIRIIRNRFNIGSSANVLRAFETCCCPCFWLLSDDDIISANAIQTILGDLSDNPDAICINYKMSSNRSKTLVSTGINDFVANLDHWGDILLISNNVYRLSGLISSIPTGYRFSYSDAPHVAVLMDSIIKNNHSVVLSRSCIIKGNQQSENKHTWSILRHSMSRLSLLDLDLSVNTRRSLSRKMLENTDSLNHVFVYCLLLSADNQADTANYFLTEIVRRHGQYCGNLFSLRAFVFCILLMMPRVSLFFIRTFTSSKKIDAVIKREESSKSSY